MKAVAKETAKQKKARATQGQTAIAVMNAVVKETAKTDPEAAAQVVQDIKDQADGKQRICEQGQDEIFDNCVKAQEQNEEEDDSNSIAQTDSQSDTTDYASAAMGLVNEVTDKLEKNAEESQTSNQPLIQTLNVEKTAQAVQKNYRVEG